MATSQNAESVSMLAGAALVAADFGKLAKISADNTVIKVAAVTDTVVGVIGMAPVAQGAEVPIVLLKGIVKIQAGASVTAGQIAIPATDAQVTGVDDIDNIPADAMGIGVFVTGGADGDIVEVLAGPLVGNTSA